LQLRLSLLLLVVPCHGFVTRAAHGVVLWLRKNGSSVLGPPRTPAAAAVVVSAVAVSVVFDTKPTTAASRPVLVAEAKFGSNGLGPFSTPV
jgi:hypothetical protein